jgi:uncharacterized metal-binding protein YceD (DUF177 family)
MSGVVPEFSRLVPLTRLGPEPFRQRIEATMQEREGLSKRFELLALHRLVAEVELGRQSGEAILLDAVFEAEFDQCCAITLEPIRGAIADRFSLLYGTNPQEDQELALNGDEPAFELLTGDAIDIGEAVAQELSLALPDFPRDPDAVIDAAGLGDPIEQPFASLAQLRKDTEC